MSISKWYNIAKFKSLKFECHSYRQQMNHKQKEQNKTKYSLTWIWNVHVSQNFLIVCSCFNGLLLLVVSYRYSCFCCCFFCFIVGKLPKQRKKKNTQQRLNDADRLTTKTKETRHFLGFELTFTHMIIPTYLWNMLHEYDSQKIAPKNFVIFSFYEFFIIYKCFNLFFTFRQVEYKNTFLIIKLICKYTWKCDIFFCCSHIYWRISKNLLIMEFIIFIYISFSSFFYIILFFFHTPKKNKKKC